MSYSKPVRKLLNKRLAVSFSVEQMYGLESIARSSARYGHPKSLAEVVREAVDWYLAKAEQVDTGNKLTGEKLSQLADDFTQLRKDMNHLLEQIIGGKVTR